MVETIEPQKPNIIPLPPAMPSTPKHKLRPNTQPINFESKEEEVNAAYEALTTHTKFPFIYNRALTVEKIDTRWHYLLRRCYELSQEDGAVSIGDIAQNNPIPFQRKLEEYGLNFLCPFYQEKPDTTWDDCLIDTATKSEPTSAICQGEYLKCVIYGNRMQKLGIGEFTMPDVTRKPKLYSIDKIDVPTVDLRDLTEWWEGEGIYG
jgi:hypothetical protein